MKIATALILLSFSITLASEERNPPSDNSVLSNTDLGFEVYAKRKESGVGKNTRIRVFLKAEPTPPSQIWTVTLLGEGDTLPKEAELVFVHLVGLDYNLKEMKSGKKYIVDGILVEDEGFFGALVVYARNIYEISEQ